MAEATYLPGRFVRTGAQASRLISMPEFPKPDFPYSFDVEQQIGVLRRHRIARGEPRRPTSRLSVATWNIANLGAAAARRVWAISSRFTGIDSPLGMVVAV